MSGIPIHLMCPPFDFNCVELRLLGIVSVNVFFIYDECFEMNQFFDISRMSSI